MPARLLLFCLTLGFTVPARAWPAEPPPLRTDLHGDRLPAGALARLGSLRFRHSGPISAVAITADGRLAASAGGSPAVSLWELPGGKPRAVLRGHDEAVTYLAFSPDGRTLASRGGGQLCLWDTARGKLLHSFSTPCGVPGLAFAPDSRTLACTVPRQGVLLLDVATGKTSAVLPDSACRGGVAFAPSGTVLASARRGGYILLWDLSTKEARHWPHSHDGDVDHLVFAPDGTLVASIGTDRSVRVWDVQRRVERLRKGPVGLSAQTVHFTDRGRSLLAVASPYRVERWDLASGKHTLVWEDDRQTIGRIAFDAAGRTAVLASPLGPHHLRLLDLARGREVPPPPGHNAYVSSVAFSADGKLVATTSWLRGDPVVRLWDTSTGRLRRELGGHDGGAWAVAFSPDGKVVATAARGPGRTVQLWDVSTARLVRTLRGHRGWLWCLAFSPDSRTLASGDGHEAQRGDSSGSVRLWDVRSGAPLRLLIGHGGMVRHLAFLSDGRALATVSDQVRLVDLASGTVQRQFDGRNPAALTPDGRLLACRLGAAGELGVYETLTGNLLFRARVPPDQLTALAFSPDSQWLATAGLRDPSVRLWDAVTGWTQGLLRGHSDEGVSALAFAPDGRTLASGGLDATALVWEVPNVRRQGGAVNLVESWADLGSAEPGRAYGAIRRLAADPARAVPYLGPRLRPVPAVADTRLARLIADLDEDDFATRQRAHAELAGHGTVAEAALRRALKGSLSAEQRKRVGELLEKLQAERQGEALRPVRAVVVLERIGSDAARQVLLRLAGGDRRALLTQEANAALRRLVRKPDSREYP
jgi:WD40 repeat protein